VPEHMTRAGGSTPNSAKRVLLFQERLDLSPAPIRMLRSSTRCAGEGSRSAQARVKADRRNRELLSTSSAHCGTVRRSVPSYVNRRAAKDDVE
jgi:hypothetical protein